MNVTGTYNPLPLFTTIKGVHLAEAVLVVLEVEIVQAATVLVVVALEEVAQGVVLEEEDNKNPLLCHINKQ